MTESSKWWHTPPLDSADQRLVDAYVTIGRPVDDLPYTEDFEKMRRLLEMEDSKRPGISSSGVSCGCGRRAASRIRA